MDKELILDKVSGVISDIEKTKLALSTLLQDYSFDKKLSVVEAFRYGSTVPVDGQENEVGADSFFWVEDHKKIMTFIEIGFDYLRSTEEELRLLIKQ